MRANIQQKLQSSADQNQHDRGGQQHHGDLEPTHLDVRLLLVELVVIEPSVDVL